MNSNQVKNIVLEYFRYKRQHTHTATEWMEEDVVLSDGKILVTVEVKISFADFSREFDKGKYQHGYGLTISPIYAPNMMYFAAPFDLAHKILHDPRHDKYGHGIIAVNSWIGRFCSLQRGDYEAECSDAKIIKKAKKLHSEPPSQKTLDSIVARMASEVITMRKQYRN